MKNNVPRVRIELTTFKFLTSDHETDALPTALTRLISFGTLDGCVIASREKMKTVNCVKSLCFLHNDGKL